MSSDQYQPFASLFEQMTDGVCVTTREGAVLYMNPAAERLLGPFGAGSTERTVCEMLCGHLATPDSPQCMSSCPLRDACSGQTGVSHHGRHGPLVAYRWSGNGVRGSERWRDLRVRCLKMTTPLFDSRETEKRFVLIEDVSAEAELERNQAAWRDMVEHDLRTPLTNIVAGLAVLGEVPEGRGLSPAERTLLAIALRGAHRLLRLLDEDLSLSRLKAGKMPVRLEAVPVAEIIKKSVEEQSPQACARRIDLVVDADPGAKALADPDLLFRIIQNLIDNALKFSPEGAVVGLSAKTSGPLLRLRVKDAGPGIPDEHLPHIFERYWQASAYRAGKIRGTGLGLAFCSEALAAMGGRIRAESAPGKGSEFIVELPVAAGGPTP